jgi:hypothetical protein
MIKQYIKIIMFKGFQEHTFQSTPTSPRCNYAPEFVVYAGMLDCMQSHWKGLFQT